MAFYNLDTRASSAQAVMPQTALFCFLALFALITSHLAVATIGVFGFVWIALFTAYFFYLIPPLALAILLLGMFFQNTLLSLLAGQVDGPQSFQAIQGTSFIIILLLGGLAYVVQLSARTTLPIEQRRLITAGIVLMMAVFVYLILGMLSVSPASALSYGRLYLSGPLLLVIGLWLGWLTPFPLLRSLLTICAVLQISWGVWELIGAYSLYSSFNINDFLALKYAARPEASNFDTIKEVIERNTRSYLNLSGAFGLDFQILRLKGPTMHAITYGYTLAFFALVMFMLKRPIISVACAALVFLVGAKGPLIMMVVSFGLYAGYCVLSKNTRLLKTGLLSFSLLYIVVGLIYGFYTKDYHVIGFMAGVKGFFANPIGHGIGVGGNLSDQSFAGRDFLAFQQFGADYALESAVGVMLYQLGIATIVLAWFYLRVWRTMWAYTKATAAESPRLITIPLAMGLLMVNSIFQEEAISPAGWGLWLLWSGIVLGQARQQAPVTPPTLQSA